MVLAVPFVVGLVAIGVSTTAGAELPVEVGSTIENITAEVPIGALEAARDLSGAAPGGAPVVSSPVEAGSIGAATAQSISAAAPAQVVAPGNPSPPADKGEDPLAWPDCIWVVVGVVTVVALLWRRVVRGPTP